MVINAYSPSTWKEETVESVSKVNPDYRSFSVEKKIHKARTPLVPALRRQRQTDLWEFEDSLIYIMSSRTAKSM